MRTITYKKQEVGLSYHCGNDNCRHIFRYVFTISWFRFRKRLYSIIDGEQTFYIGDIVQRNIDARGNEIAWLWGSELMGVITNTKTRYISLFHRPLKNKIKHLINIIIQRYFYGK